MRSLLAALLLLASPLAGCLDGSVLEQLRDDLEAEDEYEDAALLVETVEFTPAGFADPDRSYDDPDDVSSRWNETVLVPQDTRRLTANFRIDFSAPDDGALPDRPADGQVRVYVEDPSGERDNISRQKPATVGFDFQNPDAGEWTVGLEARGNGTVGVNVNGIVPVGAPAGR